MDVKLQENIITDDWKRFLDAIEFYISKPSNTDRLNEVIGSGMEVFLKFPHTIASSLFLLNEDSYEFDHNKSIPEKFERQACEIFSYLIDKGFIGMAIEKLTPVVHSPDTLRVTSFSSAPTTCDIHTTCAIITPLIVSWGIVGIAVIIVESEIIEFDQMLMRLLTLYGSLFSSSIEKAYLFRNLARAKDILEQKVAVRTMDLAQSKRELNAIFDAVHTGIMVIDNETNLVDRVNPVAARLIGAGDDSIVGSVANKYFEPIAESPTMSIFKTDNTKNFESTLTRSNGEYIPVLRNVSRINLNNKSYRIESFFDITDRKQSELALKETNELLELKVQQRTIDLQLLIQKLREEVADRLQAERQMRQLLEKEKELSEMKTRFVSMVSHEFRTPLTIIRSAAQLVERFKNKLSFDEQNEYLKRIVKTVDTMTDLIENIIFIGNAGSKRITAKPQSINLVEFCQGIINDLQLSIGKNREIKFTYRGNYSDSVLIDGKLLRLVIVNLLSNAIKYSEADKPVELELDCHQSHSYFKISDYGIGIPDSEREKIFQLFYRADNVGSISGTGLGMAVVNQSLQMLHGEIELISNLKNGTTFKIIIPNNPKAANE